MINSTARNFNIPLARDMLMNNLKWREDNRMDSILEEDFSDFEEDFKYWIKAFSYDGKPSKFMK